MLTTMGWGYMNKSELIDFVASAADMSKVAAGNALDAIIGGITSALKSGEQVTLVGFGSFVVRERAARKGHNPKTGEAIQIKAAKVPGFKAGKAFKEAMQEEK